MRDFREQNFYELLDVHPQASQQELDRAYQRARRIFNPDSVATYALFQPDELNLLRRRIEEAFRTLSDPERRAAYDQELARLEEGFGAPATPADGGGPTQGAEPEPAPTESEQALPEELGPEESPLPEEDRPADLETQASGEPIDEAPAVPAEPGGPAEEEPVADAPAPADQAESSQSAGEPEPARTDPDDQAAEAGCECPPGDGRPQMPVLDEDAEVTGALLLQARLAKGLSLDDYVQVTKISIYYLRNIENENFDDLPAPVYVRGYLRQMAQLLGLEPQRVVTGYLERKARLEAEKRK